MDTAPRALPGKALQIAAEVRRRIHDREWLPGQRIPDEADLAIEFGAARATVNKALQMLAWDGLLERRRRAGTRVAISPVRKAVLEIPVTRERIEAAGMVHGHRVLALRRSPLPPELARRLGIAAGSPFLHLRAVHYGDGLPYQYEDRWINSAALSTAARVDFRHVDANEWLLRNAPYTRAEMGFAAENADRRDARMLQTDIGRALLILRRSTWNEAGPITTVRVACHPGYSLSATG